MYNTAELIEAKFKRLIQNSGLDEELNDSVKKGFIAEVRLDSEKIKVLKLKNLNVQDFGVSLLKKFPDGAEDTTRKLDKFIWRKFKDSIIEVDSKDDETMKHLFYGIKAGFVWYQDMKEWQFFGARGLVKRLSEVV